MVKETAENFMIREVCADPAYLSKKNCQIIEDVGALPYILPKKNTKIIAYNTKNAFAWQRMVWLWKAKQDVFLQHYHQRSNVESTFSMMKRKFLPYIRSKTEQAQFNEMLCKVVCHNLSVLSNALYELNIDIDFDDN